MSSTKKQNRNHQDITRYDDLPNIWRQTSDTNLILTLVIEFYMNWLLYTLIFRWSQKSYHLKSWGSWCGAKCGNPSAFSCGIWKIPKVLITSAGAPFLWNEGLSAFKVSINKIMWFRNKQRNQKFCCNRFFSIKTGPISRLFQLTFWGYCLDHKDLYGINI